MWPSKSIAVFQQPNLSANSCMSDIKCDSISARHIVYPTHIHSLSVSTLEPNVR